MSAFSSESSGFGALILGGIITIMVVGGAFSALSRGMFETTSAVKHNEERAGRIHDQGVLLASLKRDLARQKKLLIEQKEVIKPVAEGERLKAELEQLNDVVADLQLEASERREDIEELEEERARYQKSVRGRIWSKYLKTELKAEHVVGTMKYKKPIINKIDPAGLMVMHSGGSARVDVAQLTSDFRKLLDLDISEARRVMSEMRLKDALAKRSRTKMAAAAGQPSALEVDAILEKNLLEGIAKVEKYFDLIRYAEETARTAKYNDRYSSNRSVPGKLETWAERAKRFERAAVKYRKQYVEAVAEVRVIDPDYSSPKR